MEDDMLEKGELFVKNTFTRMTFRSETKRGLAGEIRRKLIKHFKLNPEHVHVWSPEETKERGWGSGWSVCAEEGPFEWTIWMTGWCEDIYNHPAVLCEPYNHFVLNLYDK